MPCKQDEIERISSEPMSDEDRYYLERAWKEPVESISRIEDTAKFLIGATAGTSGLFLSALRLAVGSSAVMSGYQWMLPFICWSLSVICLVLVLFPRRYNTYENAPQAWKKAFLSAGKWKYAFLCLGTLLFILGILHGMWLLPQ